MSVNQMREYLYNIPKYNGARGWINKVKNMPDRQVIAVYYAMRNRFKR